VNETNKIKDNVVYVLRKGEPEEPMRVVDTKIVAVLQKASGEVEVHETKNIVTTAGDTYYAQRGAGTTPTNFNSAGTFNGKAFLSQATATPAKSDNYSTISGTIQNTGGTSVASTYPKTNDGDVDNTGAGVSVVTYLYTFSTGAAYTGVTDVSIAGSAPTGTDPLLMRAKFASSFTKATTDTLKVFINHTMNGQ
jgi:hypothetical protein